MHAHTLEDVYITEWQINMELAVCFSQFSVRDNAYNSNSEETNTLNAVFMVEVLFFLFHGFLNRTINSIWSQCQHPTLVLCFMCFFSKWTEEGKIFKHTYNAFDWQQKLCDRFFSLFIRYPIRLDSLDRRFDRKPRNHE